MKCPGQDMQYWKEGSIFEAPCPQCGKVVEFYKDDTSRICHGCGKRFVNPQKDFGCASYCQYAEQCLGTLPEEFVGQQDNLLKDKIAVEVKRLYKTDFKAIGQATRIARHAEHIGKIEGGQLAVILCAAYLHDIGRIALTEQQPSPPNMRTASAQIAKELLSRLKAKDAILHTVLAIITEEATIIDTIECQVVTDAIRIATLEQSIKEQNPDAVHFAEAILTTLKTAGGREIARKLMQKQDDL